MNQDLHHQIQDDQINANNDDGEINLIDVNDPTTNKINDAGYHSQSGNAVGIDDSISLLSKDMAERDLDEKMN